jgi:predicted nucleic acid-binding protein
VTSLVVDASVAVKWVVRQPLSLEASNLLAAETRLLAPSLLLAEAGNGLWRHVRVGDITDAQARLGLEAIEKAFAELIEMRQLHHDALNLALHVDHPVYDCFYLALARREGAPLVTADKRLVKLGATLADIEVRAL